MSKRSWIPIVLAVLGVVFLLAILGIGAGAYYLYNHVGIETVSAESAEREFVETRQRFGEQPPLLIVEGRQVKINPAEKERTRVSDKQIDDIHIMVWDPNEDKLVRLRIPFWLLSLKTGGGKIRLNSGSSIFSEDEVHLDIEDLERHGPGLILDVTDRGGERVLIWAQ